MRSSSRNDDAADVAGLGVPKAVLLAWNRAPAPTKGPKPRWTLDQLLEAAVDLGDRGGIEAITMSGLAKALGSGTMTLYRYIESREDLVVLASNLALGVPPAFEGATWREELRAWVLDLRRVYKEHPWLTAVPVGTEPLLPSYVHRLEAGLGCIEDLGLPGGRAIAVLTLLWTYTRSDAEQSAELVTAAEGRSPADTSRFFADRLRGLGTGGEFSRLIRALESDRSEPLPGTATWSDDGEFLDAVEIILNGVEAARPRPSAGRNEAPT